MLWSCRERGVIQLKRLCLLADFAHASRLSGNLTHSRLHCHNHAVSNPPVNTLKSTPFVALPSPFPLTKLTLFGA